MSDSVDQSLNIVTVQRYKLNKASRERIRPRKCSRSKENALANRDLLNVREGTTNVITKLYRKRLERKQVIRSGRHYLATFLQQISKLREAVRERISRTMRADERLEQLLAALLCMKSVDLVRQRKLECRFVFECQREERLDVWIADQTGHTRPLLRDRYS